jgi:carbamate kinase
MRVVVALGGNALLRRGQAMTMDNQRENVRVACDYLAPIAEQHDLIISHGNGPQIGPSPRLIRTSCSPGTKRSSPQDRCFPR